LQRLFFVCEKAEHASPNMMIAFTEYLQQKNLRREFNVSCLGTAKNDLKAKVSPDDIVVSIPQLKGIVERAFAEKQIEPKMLLFVPFFRIPKSTELEIFRREFSEDNLIKWGDALLEKIRGFRIPQMPRKKPRSLKRQMRRIRRLP